MGARAQADELDVGENDGKCTGIDNWHEARRRKMLDRNADMIEKYKSGATLQQIGNLHGITRERVRQIMNRAGIDPMSSGRAIRSLLTVETKREKRKKANESTERFKRKTWGISVREWKDIREKYGYRPFASYHSHRQRAKKRGIDWEITFPEWWQIWQDSGKWEQRGLARRWAGSYCMARYGDCGPYSAQNVYICTCVQNTIDYWSWSENKRKRDAKSGAYCK
jgi:uncharacterized protein YoaH (UPF0181 family)